ncbi:hypothetical protein A3Q56_00560 [Intoshia linei]|uniref:Integrase zinc-binding domain-containing protein n=1 Tax=Intoshia linei TaxID=1819745 RepID=A0A177BDA6_9BILA|nr:hypothetical protein A3Q56_00560 [Intoshia linei]
MVKFFHDPKAFCHPGINKTIKLIQAEYFWNSMTKEISEWVQQCHKCNTGKGYGVPKQIHTDCGSQNESNIIKNLSLITGFIKTNITPYRHNSVGKIERLNHVDIWDKMLPMILMSIVNTPTEKHKYSPALMVFYKELSLPIYDLNSYLNRYYTNKKAKHNQTKHNQRIKFYYDKKSIKKPSYYTQNESNNPISNKNMLRFRPREKLKIPHRIEGIVIGKIRSIKETVNKTCSFIYDTGS